MAWVELTHTGDATIAAPPAAAFALLADPERWGPLQPYVARVVPEGDRVYRWEFDDMIAVGVRLRPRYRTRLEDNGADEIRWTPVEPEGFSCAGAMRLEPLGPGATRLRLSVTFGAEVNLPEPFVIVARPAVQAFFDRQMTELLANLAARGPALAGAGA